MLLILSLEYLFKSYGRDPWVGGISLLRNFRDADVNFYGWGLLLANFRGDSMALVFSRVGLWLDSLTVLDRLRLFVGLYEFIWVTAFGGKLLLNTL